MKKPTYLKNQEDAEFFGELRKRVNARVAAIPENRGNLIKVKVFLLPVIYLSCYLVAIFNGDKPWLYLGCFALMGIDLVLLYLNLIHEAAHNNIFKNRKYNKAVMMIFDFVGANSFIWERRHIVSHHAYPNVDGWDTDVEQSGPILVYPHTEPKGIQKYQHRYFFLIYPLYLFNWMFIRDFRDFFDKRRIIQKTQAKIPTIEKVKMIFFKLFYFFYQIGLPILFLGVSWKLAVGAWFLQVLVASVFALVVLLPVHALESNEFPEMDAEKNLPYSWLQHQFRVTNDIKENNSFIRYVMGNFNYHVAHHLFPNYSYEYYPEITDEIRKFAEEKGLPYKQFPLRKALNLHYQLLKSNAIRVGEVLEESM